MDKHKYIFNIIFSVSTVLFVIADNKFGVLLNCLLVILYNCVYMIQYLKRINSINISLNKNIKKSKTEYQKALHEWRLDYGMDGKEEDFIKYQNKKVLTELKNFIEKIDEK